LRQLKISSKITNRESLALDKYLSEIAKLEMLTPEQEVDLAQRVRSGDEAALEKLTKANLRFVVSVAKQYQNQGLSLSDLINEGNLGLMKAAKRFDETKGFKFISYAVWWIRQSILQAIVEYSRLVRIPLNKINSYNRINDAYLNFLQEFEREPSHEELAEILNLPLLDITSVLTTGAKHLSMDAPIGDEEDGSSLIELLVEENNISPDNDLMIESLKKEIHSGMSALSPRELEILSCFFGINGKREFSLEEISDRFDLSRERVRQIKERALRRLRKTYNKRILRSYLSE
jgi:RNA polymerase primary sigma factor